MEKLLNLIPDSPIISFTVLLLVILTIPPIFEKIRLPGLVGLLFAGVILGDNGLKILDPDSETMELLSVIGKVYLMFVAGLEIDLADFRKNKDRSLGFGLATFLFPLVIGGMVGYSFGYGLNSSILIGSLLASHTLLGYPIVNRLGVVRNEAVTVTIGATIFTDIAALLVLAICVSVHSGEFSAVNLIIQLLGLAIYAAAVLFGLDWAGKEYFRRSGDEESNQFLFVLLAVFLASAGAQLINVDRIVGAFLAGLAVNDVVGSGPVKEKIEFVGSTLFIPFFFVGMGLLIDIPAFVETVTTPLALKLMLGIVASLLVAKFLAALAAKLLYSYRWDEMLTMWALSIPQVAATLAAALAAFQALNLQGDPLIDKPVFNSVIVLMLVTSILGPVITAQFAKNLPVPKTKVENRVEDWGSMPAEWQTDPLVSESQNFNVVVPICNPHTERYLIEMAALLARHEGGTIVPLSIAMSHVQMDNPSLNVALRQSQKLIQKAREVSEEFKVQALPKIRIDDDVAQGISRTAREENANLIVMGWGNNTGLRARLFGNVIDNVFWSVHCPVAVMRLLDDPINIRSILVPVKNITPQSITTIQFAQLFADINQASVVLLHVCSPGTSLEQIATFERGLNQVVTDFKSPINYEIKTVVSDDVAAVIIQACLTFDLVIVRSMRRRTAGGLAVSDITDKIIKEVSCSMVLFGEPNSNN